MTDQPVSVFINPTAGRGRAGRRMTDVRNLFAAALQPIELYISDDVGDLEEQVERQVSRGTRRVVIVGGDGSVSEAVNGLQRATGDASLGLIPSGTGNDFAKACGIPLDWELAANSLVQRIAYDEATRQVDIGRVNDRYFANGVGIGFDAKVTRIARSIRWPIGNIVYLVALLRGLIDGVATPELEISGTRTDFRGPATLATICNGAFVGGLFHIAPAAANDDGKLDLLIADPVSRSRILALLPKLMRGEHMNEPEISHQLVDKITIRASAPVESHIDGEVQALQDTFEIEILSGALHLL
ncbi:MAG: diacylglycerol/lipid kinase family protein [Woeseiaceae bacterium]